MLRAETVCRDAGLPTAETSLVLVRHGCTGCPDSQDERREAARIATSGRFADVRLAFLAQAPRLDHVLARLTGPAVVVDLLAGGGRHVDHEIPDTLARRGDRHIVHAGAIGDDAALTDVIIDIVRMDTEQPTSVRAA